MLHYLHYFTATVTAPVVKGVSHLPQKGKYISIVTPDEKDQSQFTCLHSPLF